MKDREIDDPSQGASDGDVPVAGTLVSRYVVIKPVGRGGQAVVFLAYDPRLDRRIALKLLPVAKLGGAGRERLLREAQALARLSHPNVVPVYDVGTLRETAFVAMEFVDGVTLEEWLRQPHPLAHKLAVMREAGRGLAAAHDAGLVHRDFKPANVLIGADGRVRVVDFGLARSLPDALEASTVLSTALSPAPDDSGAQHRHLRHVTRDEHIVGTPAFMSPESLANGLDDARSDQYSFGLTLHRALVGDGAAAAEATVTLPTLSERPARPQPPQQPQPPRPPELPPWLARIVQRTLSPDPADRFPSMHAVLVALDRDPAAQRRRVLALGAIVMLVALLCAVVLDQQRHERLRCKSGDSRIAAVWSADAAARLHRAFAASSLPYAPALADTVSRQLDDYAHRWAAMDDDSCAATHVRGEQSEEALDLRSACLERRRGELAALVTALDGANADAVRNAGQAVQSLTPLDSCADVTALRAQQPRPRDAAQLRRIAALEERVAEVQARFAVGHFRQAAERGESLLREVTDAGYLPLLATLELWLGRSYKDLQDPEAGGHSSKALAHFSASFSSALKGHSDHLAAQAAALLAMALLYDTEADHLERHRQWVSIAEATIHRAGGDAIAESVLTRGRCFSLFETAPLSEQLTCFEDLVHKLTEAKQLKGRDLDNLGQCYVDIGRLDEGVRWAERGVQLSTEQLGASHPATLSAGATLCYAYEERGDLDKALATCTAALREEQRDYPDQPMLQAPLLLLEAEAQRLSGQYAAALATVHALSALNTENRTLDLETESGLIAYSQGHHAEAVRHLRAALAYLEKALPPGHPNVLLLRRDLGEALLHAGDRLEARRILEPAEASKGRIGALLYADIQFALAQSLPPEQHARALQLAERARAGYATAPATPRFAQRLAAMNAFLATP
jgi:tetratricopeptide (TPR) repeat protein/predicted Ser/Thr protein kinase